MWGPPRLSGPVPWRSFDARTEKDVRVHAVVGTVHARASVVLPFGATPSKPCHVRRHVRQRMGLLAGGECRLGAREEKPTLKTFWVVLCASHRGSFARLGSVAGEAMRLGGASAVTNNTGLSSPSHAICAPRIANSGHDTRTAEVRSTPSLERGRHVGKMNDHTERLFSLCARDPFLDRDELHHVS